jgi:hypothetical protein
VVHVDHGIGIYRGLVKLEAGAGVNDFLELEYQNGDRLFLPVDRLNLVQKYLGVEGASPRVDRLGGKSWERVKKAGQKGGGKDRPGTGGTLCRPPGLAGSSFSPPDPVPSGSLKPPLPLRKPRTSCRPSRTSSKTCGRTSPWTASSAAMWATARPKWPSGPRSRPPWTAFRWRSWCPPRCWRSSTTTPSRNAWPPIPWRCGS